MALRYRSNTFELQPFIQMYAYILSANNFSNYRSDDELNDFQPSSVSNDRITDIGFFLENEKGLKNEFNFDKAPTRIEWKSLNLF